MKYLNVVGLTQQEKYILCKDNSIKMKPYEHLLTLRPTENMDFLESKKI